MRCSLEMSIITVRRPLDRPQAAFEIPITMTTRMLRVRMAVNITIAHAIHAFPRTVGRFLKRAVI